MNEIKEEEDKTQLLQPATYHDIVCAGKKFKYQDHVFVAKELVEPPDLDAGGLIFDFKISAKCLSSSKIEILLLTFDTSSTVVENCWKIEAQK